MTPRDLFKRRLLEEWRFQYRVWRTVLDWTVILYLGIPALVFLWIQYRSGWGRADSLDRRCPLLGLDRNILPFSLGVERSDWVCGKEIFSFFGNSESGCRL